MSCCSNKSGGQGSSRANAGATPMYSGASNAPRQSNAGRTPFPRAVANAPRQSNAGRTPFPRAVAGSSRANAGATPMYSGASRPSRTNAGATPMFSSASKRAKAASRKKIELHVFQENEEGEGEWEPLDQNPPSRRPEQEMAREYMQAMTPGPCSPCSTNDGYQSSNLMNFPDTPTRQPYYQEDNGENYDTPEFAEEGEDEWNSSGNYDSSGNYASSGNYQSPTPNSLAGSYDSQDSYWIQNRNILRKEFAGTNTSPMYARTPQDDRSPCFSPGSDYDSDLDDADMPLQRRRLEFDEDETPPFQLGSKIRQRISDLNTNPEVNISFNPISGGVTLNLPTTPTCQSGFSWDKSSRF